MFKNPLKTLRKKNPKPTLSSAMEVVVAENTAVYGKRNDPGNCLGFL